MVEGWQQAKTIATYGRRRANEWSIRCPKDDSTIGQCYPSVIGPLTAR